MRKRLKEFGERHRGIQVAAVVGAYALAGAALWLTGHREFGWENPWDRQQPPAVEAPAKPALTKQFFDNLQPQNYHGETYEWGAVANQASPAQATPQLLEMIQKTESAGVQVNTWGAPAAGEWGIKDVTIFFTDGTHTTYYDTPHKLAIIQYMSNLNS